MFPWNILILIQGWSSLQLLAKPKPVVKVEGVHGSKWNGHFDPEEGREVAKDVFPKDRDI